MKKAIHQILFERVYNIINKYDNNYGKVSIWETPKHLIVEFYTGGWSENEEMLSELTTSARPTIIDGATTIFTFQKGLLDAKLWEKIGRAKCKIYKYALRRD